ncbi:transcriptional regulator [Vibrio mimicus]|uniref:Transcriptional regulator n=1 Tax=Vibrio mimicus TaxID=674 RepID=A0A2J9VJT0_VIBMI|nr:transcriptional regulator [Vibrio mimicus]
MIVFLSNDVWHRCLPPFLFNGDLHLKHTHNKRLKRDCQRVAYPVPMNCGGYGCCV